MGEITDKQIGFYQYVGILKRYYSKDITNYIAENPGQLTALAVVRDFIGTLHDRTDQGDCLVLCGSPGSGKTHLGIAIIKQAMAVKMTSKYITVPEMIKKVRATYKTSGTTMEQIVKELSEVKILVVDEVGVEVAKDDTTILFDIIDTRYRHQLPTIIISNLNQEKLTQYIGERVMDRLSEGNGVVIAFDWSSHRTAKQ